MKIFSIGLSCKYKGLYPIMQESSLPFSWYFYDWSPGKSNVIPVHSLISLFHFLQNPSVPLYNCPKNQISSRLLYITPEVFWFLPGTAPGYNDPGPVVC